MPLPYRTVLQLAASAHAVRLAEQEIENWLESRKKVDAALRIGFVNGTFFQPGHHRLSKNSSLTVARDINEKDGTVSVAFRFLEVNKDGTWQVDVVALDVVESSHRSDLLLVEATRIDHQDAPGEVDPPAVVKQLLAREVVFDGETHVTAVPKLIGIDEVEEVVRAVVDPNRSVSVTVGASPGQKAEAAFQVSVESLTAKVIGASAVFVLSTTATREFNNRLPAHLRIDEGRVRTYQSKVDVENEADGRRHRILGPARFARAIYGPKKKVAQYLQSAFAVETRLPMLSLALPSRIRRARFMLEEHLNEFARSATVEKRVDEAKRARLSESKERFRKPSTRPVEHEVTVDLPLLIRIRKTILRWLNKDEAEVSVQHLDELDDKFERLELISEELANDLRRADRQIEKLDADREELYEDFEFRGLELAESESSASRYQNEVHRLRMELSKANLGAVAYGEGSNEHWSTPDDLVELALGLQKESDRTHLATTYVLFSGDLAKVEEIQARDQSGLYVQRTWECIHALHDYAELCKSGSFAGNVQSYLDSSEHDGFKVPTTRHAAGETKQTMEQFGDERVFPVPKSVSPIGQITMEAHFKINQSNTFAPRMYYYDDTSNSGKIYIGYLGRHLSNTKTKNA
jgi:hypothetical protein